MRMSQMFFQTMKEDPKDADITSNKLLIRANLVRKLVSGVYTYLPLGLKVLRNIEKIVREEMDKKGAQEILCSSLQPKELWDESGRWEKYGVELMRLKDRNEREFCLGPTHEEVFTDIVRKQISSYKQLPVNLYQIQTKYRDEKRPRFGLIRGREFLMKDAYTFDVSEQGLDKAYDDMYDAYGRIFTRCGLKHKAVLADTGAIGGDNSHQFMGIADIGESQIIYCDNCDYGADQEKADTVIDKYNSEEKMGVVEVIDTPNMKTIEEVSKFLNISPKQTVKALVYKAIDKVVMVLVRGDREVNEIKVCNALGIGENDLEMAGEDVIRTVLKVEKGFIGPVGAKCEIIVDREVEVLRNFYTGANEKDKHIKNINFGRDFDGKVADVIKVNEGDICPKCGKTLKSERGIEIGQIFKLGTKYSKAMNCVFVDENGKEQPMVMGCYGIGVSRTLAAIIEQNNDANGITWPMEVAPYKVIVIPVSSEDEVQMSLAEKIYTNLKNAGIEVLMDDRKERPGVKFKDADLIGIPMRVTVGKKAGEGVVEFKLRNEAEVKEMVAVEVVESIIKLIK